MYIGPRQISRATVGWLGNGCLRGGVTRSGLARGLGGREGWLAHDGRPSTVTGMRVLPPLAEEPGLTLPEADRRACGSMMERRHPEGWRRAPGGRLRHWIVSGAHGRPGGPGFVPASRRPGPRDGAIGRSARARTADMGPVPDSHRFLIRPSVRVHGPASLALRLAAERVADDWRAPYGVRPVPACTPVGPDHAGSGVPA